jgi:hypothetical protein
LAGRIDRWPAGAAFPDRFGLDLGIGRRQSVAQPSLTGMYDTTMMDRIFLVIPGLRFTVATATPAPGDGCGAALALSHGSVPSLNSSGLRLSGRDPEKPPRR